MAITMTLLEQRLHALQREVVQLNRLFDTFRGYVNRQFGSIHARLDAIEEKMATKEDLRRFATREDLHSFAIKDDLRGFATKEDLRRFATKKDLRKFATKDDLVNFATKDDLKNFATKEDLRNFATKDDLRNFATKADLEAVLEATLSEFETRILNAINGTRDQPQVV